MTRPAARTVSAVIPAFNEEGRVGATVRAVLEAGLADEVVVVDDGSRDATATAAAAAGARVLRLPSNRGKGEALNRGVAAASGDVLLFLDADLGATAGEAARLLEPVLAGEADMAVAVFPEATRPAGFGLAVGLARLGVSRLTGLSLRAPLSGQRALTRAVYRAVGGCAPGWGVEVGLALGAARAGFRIVEVPTAMAHAPTGRDLRGFLHRGRQLAAVARVLAGHALRRNGRRRGADRWRAG